MGFSSLLKQKIKGKNCAVFCFAGFFFKFFSVFLCYEVFAKQKKEKKSFNGPVLTSCPRPEVRATTEAP
jgi:hypothetical protein